MRVKFSIFLVVVAVSLAAASSAFGQANIIVVPNDSASTGFNDPTPASPVGGNNGTTVGQQRLIAFQTAANIWGASLNSGPTITVRASWAALPCDADGGTLGSAGPTAVARNFANAPFLNTWYPPALANALSGTDSNPNNPEISARFNLSLGTAGCLPDNPWYYGLDGLHGSRVDLVTVVLHELGHGLGFQTFTDGETGNFAGSTSTSSGLPSIWDRFLRDDSTGKLWVNMTAAERAASAVNTGNLVWAGPQLAASVPGALSFGMDSSNRVRMFAPNPYDDGSSVSHFDRSALPNLLMEPNISNDLDHSVAPPNDLTLPLLKDIGWNTAAIPTPSPPPNDNFAAAQVISGCTGTVNGTNAGATAEPGEPDHGSNGGTRSIWYQWQAPFNGQASITTSGSRVAGGDQLDTVLAVYTGSSVNALGTPVIQNDDEQNPQILTSRVTFQASAGTTYHIAVGGFNNLSGGDFGSITLGWFQDCNPWTAAVVDPSWVDLKTWTVSGQTSGYIKLTFPDTGYRVSLWGPAVHTTQNGFAVNAVIERFRGVPTPAITSTAQISTLGSLAPGNYTFELWNSGAPVKTFNFTVSATPPPPNPIDDAREFVRWQYKDFLRREPDGPGWDHWTAEITQCANPGFRLPAETEAACVTRKRANTSAAFFMSPEFLSSGYFVLRVYRGSLGRMPHFGGGNTAADEFTRDAATVSAGIVVNNQLSPAVINANKQAFVNEFVTRAEFRAIYDGLNNTQYVDKLFQTTGITPTAAERQALINGLGNGSETRPSVLFKVVDGTVTINDQGQLRFDTTYGKAFYDAQFNPSFVQIEYFGYLLRDPDDAGYAFWLNKLNTFGNFVDAQMVLSFINSPEYRFRFGAP